MTMTTLIVSESMIVCAVCAGERRQFVDNFAAVAMERHLLGRLKKG
ncbi:MAG: hypothetical protein KME19_10680 [Microcoleus vaginatus WJT46-NPBG5]|nr:hypothetical protein [Microcoleus vaginatus WJT46-NPBG5]